MICESHATMLIEAACLRWLMDAGQTHNGSLPLRIAKGSWNFGSCTVTVGVHHSYGDTLTEALLLAVEVAAAEVNLWPLYGVC